MANGYCAGKLVYELAVQTRPNSFKLVQICANTLTFMNFNEIFINMPFLHHFFATMPNLEFQAIYSFKIPEIGFDNLHDN